MDFPVQEAIERFAYRVGYEFWWVWVIALIAIVALLLLRTRMRR